MVLNSGVERKRGDRCTMDSVLHRATRLRMQTNVKAVYIWDLVEGGKVSYRTETKPSLKLLQNATAKPNSSSQ